MAKKLHESSFAHENTNLPGDEQVPEISKEKKLELMRLARELEVHGFANSLERAARLYARAAEPELAKKCYKEAGDTYCEESRMEKTSGRKADYLYYAKENFLKAGVPPEQLKWLDDDIKRLRNANEHDYGDIDVDYELLSGPGE